MRKVLDGEQGRRAVLASFVTTLPEGHERLLRELLDQAAGEAEHAWESSSSCPWSCR
jgi:hypothetical protein